MTVLVDSNVILDILTNDRNWFDWSALKNHIFRKGTAMLIGVNLSKKKP
ncbi:hypothetical protein [Nostoc favosum]|uniref:DNA-binding protein n=1 Tax=Nostoc favosum CHAB5714 TaxID=2780399 RepID=A0ABS8IL06_9NOSO|nr:hypothetical protein [Nostoc favosum]MCC5604491.1 hypothetical protein [Nostoc favosum CHAB5714]